MNDNELVLEFELSHAPEKVWRALTDPALVSRWLMNTDDMQLTVGQKFKFRREPLPQWDGVVNCEILEAREPEFLSYTWQALGVDTIIRWTLEPIATGTRLKLEQTGFRPDQKQAFGGARMGWKQMAGEQLPRVLAELA